MVGAREGRREGEREGSDVFSMTDYRRSSGEGWNNLSMIAHLTQLGRYSVTVERVITGYG